MSGSRTRSFSYATSLSFPRETRTPQSSKMCDYPKFVILSGRLPVVALDCSWVKCYHGVSLFRHDHVIGLFCAGPMSQNNIPDSMGAGPPPRPPVTSIEIETRRQCATIARMHDELNDRF
ncbi:hypothetical protein MRX96_013226 [Rhipicephalus microplus]